MPPGAEAAVTANILTPRPGLIKIGSPFFTIYLHQALRKLEMPGESINIILRDYLQMLDCDATTVWESFPGAVVDRMEDKPFPTRSHCHAWSSVPVELFPGVILGLKSTGAGNRSFTVSPYPGNLDWASGSRMTAQGKVSVSWKIDRRQNKMQINVKCPETVQCSFLSNSHLKDFEIEFICTAE